MHYQHLSEAVDQRVCLCSQSDSVTVAHREVDLATVAPQGGGVGWHPSGEQPGTDKTLMAEFHRRHHSVVGFHTHFRCFPTSVENLKL